MVKPFSLKPPTERIPSFLPSQMVKVEKVEKKDEENGDNNEDTFSVYKYLSLIASGVIVGIWLWKK
jgi:hypothetical protein